MEAKVEWQGRMTFTGSAGTGFEVPLGAAQAVGGDEDGFRPMQLIAVGLAGCTAMDVISILSKKRQDVTEYEVRVDASQAEDHPKVYTGAVIEYHVTGHAIQEAAVIRAIELSATRYCPAQAMFIDVFPMSLKYFIYESQGEGQRVLIHSGENLRAEAAA
jgi:putative redox protein